MKVLLVYLTFAVLFYILCFVFLLQFIFKSNRFKKKRLNKILVSQDFQKLAFTLKNKDELIKAVESFLQNTLIMSKTAIHHDEMLTAFNTKQKNLLAKKAPLAPLAPVIEKSATSSLFVQH